MNIPKYDEFITEKAIIEALLESKLYYSNNFKNLLTKIKGNKVANELAKLYSKDIDKIRHNYIDTTDDNSRVSFIPDGKAQEIIGDVPDTYTIVGGGFLTHGAANDRIFKRLDYERPEEQWRPGAGTVGIIKNEAIGPSSGRTYVVFEEYGVENPRRTVINKNSVRPTEPDVSGVWSTSRNPVNIGRLARAILRTAGVDFTDKDIEDFVNSYKATHDFMADALAQFDVVNGSKIPKWYHGDRYVEGGGSLNNSCMAYADEDYFDIYKYNPKQVSLVILYSDDGSIKDDKYISKKIKGRALLWNAKIDGKEETFMDRIYTAVDSDVELFRQYATSKGWWFKDSQTMDPMTNVTNGTSTKSTYIYVTLDILNHDYYPYLDTLCYLNGNVLSNDDSEWALCLRDTDGGWEEYDDY